MLEDFAKKSCEPTFFEEDCGVKGAKFKHLKSACAPSFVQEIAIWYSFRTRQQFHDLSNT